MKRWVNTLLIVVFAAVFLISGFFLLRHYRSIRKSKETYDQLAEIVEKVRTQPQGTDTPAVEVYIPARGETVGILPEYAELYAINNDLVGWLTIDGTNINYPVVQSPYEPNYYLYRDFYKNSSKGGCLYAKEECDINAPSDNITIYGHNTRGGAIMFNGLNNYTKKSFWEEHPYICFDTLTQRQTYQIIAVFKTTANEEDGFPYYEFVDAASEEEFYEFLENCQAHALYDTGLSAQYGEKLITLSTCEYTLNNGRLAVVAKKIGE